MSEKNKALHRRFYEEVHEGGNLDLLDGMVTDDYVHHSAQGLALRGADGLRDLIAGVRAAFPDLQDTIEEQIAEGDSVMTRWTMAGTHRGEWMGIPASGKRIEVAIVSIARFRGERCYESWEMVDMLGMMQQMGAIPV